MKWVKPTNEQIKSFKRVWVTRCVPDSFCENEAIINYLKENSFPVNSLTHRAALKRYLKGLLTFDQDNKILKLINE